MRAMVLTAPGPIAGADRLELRELAVPEPGPDEVLVRVLACAVCLTDLHVVEGDLPHPKANVVPGHQVVGIVEARGEGTERFELGQRVGVPWLGGADGTCPYCRAGLENLCEAPEFTGYSRDGGYAEYLVARADFVHAIPESYGDVDATPLLCAGLIGYRSLRLADVRPLDGAARLGLFGFGNSAQLMIQVAVQRGYEVYVYTRSEEGLRKAREMGAVWTGRGKELPDAELDSVIIYAPAGELVPLALSAVRKAGVVVCAGIHMSPIPQFEYELLWGERILRSVANLTRDDGREFLSLVAEQEIRTEVQVFPLEQANEALRAHKTGALSGTAVLVP
jgi:alcohol dehydrogenase, propanol-preferring